MPSCFNVCWAAPRAGVFVVAPQRMPTMSGKEMPKPRLPSKAIKVPTSTTAMASILSRMPPLRKELKNPGPTCKPNA